MSNRGKKNWRRRVYKMKMIHWPAKINGAKMDHFPLTDFHCSLYADRHLCNFPLLLELLRRPCKDTGTLTILGQALPIPPSYNNTLERNSHWDTTVSHVRVNCSQHVCEQCCPHWILRRSQQGLRSVASWLCLAMFSVMLSCENKDRLSSGLNLLMF